MTIELNPVYGAPFTAKSGQANPDDILRRIMTEDMPGGTEADTWPLFKDAILKDDELIEACLRSYHIRARTRIERLMPRSSKKKRRAQAATARAAEAVVKTKRALVLDYLMPNGKTLRYCTFGEALRFGGGIAAIGKLGKPNQIIGEVITEKQAYATMQKVK